MNNLRKVKEAIRELAFEEKIDKLCYQVEEYGYFLFRVGKIYYVYLQK